MRSRSFEDFAYDNYLSVYVSEFVGDTVDLELEKVIFYLFGRRLNFYINLSFTRICVLVKFASI